MREHYEEEEKRIRELNVKKQALLFEAARQQLAAEQTSNPVSKSGFGDIFAQVRANAANKAAVFLRGHPEVSLEGAKVVYEVLLVNTSKAKKAVVGLAQTELKAGFRRLAVALHPDKNKHPHSKEAF